MNYKSMISAVFCAAFVVLVIAAINSEEYVQTNVTKTQLAQASKNEVVDFNNINFEEPLAPQQLETEEPELALFEDKSKENDIEVAEVMLKMVGYELPFEHWSAKIDGEVASLTITPSENESSSPHTSNGYLFITAYTYGDASEPHEMFCLVAPCMGDGSKTSFKETKIGNNDGFRAYGLDTDTRAEFYYVAKDEVFYLIGTFSPNEETEFARHKQKVLNSLSF